MRDDCPTIALGLPEVRVLWEKETQQEIRVEVEYRTSSALCPCCGQKTPKVHSMSLQHKRDRGLWDKPVFLALRKRRFRCPGCGKVFTEPDPVCGARRRSTQRFREYLGEEAIRQPVCQVAQRQGVGEGLVRHCLTEVASRVLGSQKGVVGQVEILGMDEFSVKRNRVSDTTLCDLERRQIVGVVSGCGQKAVEEWFDQLPHPEKVKAVVMDMHEPFRQAVEMCLPQAKVVVDKFHVVRQVNRALDQVRVSLQAREQQGKRRSLFTGRYLLLKAVENLTPEEAGQLTMLLRAYPELRRAWELKEAFRAWYRTSGREPAEGGMALWEASVREQGIGAFQSLLPMIKRWRKEILNYFDYPYTNGFVEGKNNRIKVIKRLAYGYRNRANFRQRIFLTNRKEHNPKVHEALHTY